MAGAYWHFYTANRVLERLRPKLEADDGLRCMITHRTLFLAGSQGPDFNFYPGGDSRLSSLSHGKRPADLGRAMLRLAKTDQERSFAFGWLMHLATDTITHPLVNWLILRYFPEKTHHGTDVNAYPLGHHRVEWGIDIGLLKDERMQSYLPDPLYVLATALEMRTLVNQAFGKIFQYPVSEEGWKGGIKGMIRYLSVFETAWRLTGRIQDKSLIRQAVKSLGFHAIVAPIAKLVARRNPENGAGVFIPISPSQRDMEEVYNHSEEVAPVFERYLDNRFKTLPNHTG